MQPFFLFAGWNQRLGGAFAAVAADAAGEGAGMISGPLSPQAVIDMQEKNNTNFVRMVDKSLLAEMRKA